MRLILLRYRQHRANDGVVWRGWFRLGKSHEIELSLHLFFVLTVLVVTSVLAQVFFPRFFPGWTTVVYWLVAISVTLTDSLAGLLHELGHAVVALARGRSVYCITLYGWAAATRRSSGTARTRDTVAIALAGPLSHLLMASALLFIWTLLPPENEPLRVAAGFPALSNFIVGMVNLLPVTPLDGGRVVRALLAGVVVRA
jgi:Zn-dependent protease